MDVLFDLPAHLFFIHAPIVLMPLAFLLALGVLSRPAWRRRFAPGLLLLSFVVVVTTFLARGSGEEFDELLEGAVDVERHQSLANTTMILVVLFFVALVVLVVLDRRPTLALGEPDTAVQRVLAVATAIFALLATVWMVRTGHEGAKITWSGVVQSE